MFLNKIRNVLFGDLKNVNNLEGIYSSIGAKKINRLLFNNVKPVNVMEKWKTKFENENVPEIKSSLNNIMAHVLNKKRLDDLDKMVKLNDIQINRFEELCECRIARMPIQYIIGEWDFRNVTLKMQPPVFIPRPETEELVELILQQFDCKRTMRFLEIGCGTGAISIALLNALPKATCTAIDQSKIACDLTLNNVTKYHFQNRIKIVNYKLTNDTDKNGFNECDNLLDLIVSNPPYVPTSHLHDLEPEIQLYEDLRALDGGKDGLNIIKLIILLASKKLRAKGMLWLEVDPSHPNMIEKYLNDNDNLKLKFVASYKDMFKKERFVEIIKV